MSRKAEHLAGIVGTTIDWLSVLIVSVALCLGGYKLWDAHFGATTPPDVPYESEAVVEFWELAETGRWVGAPRPAPITLLVYSDYACGFCEQLHRTLTTLLRRYPQHLAISIKHFVDPTRLGVNLIPLAAECAGEQGKFWAYHDAAFMESTSASQYDAWLRLAEASGIEDLESFGLCVRTHRYERRIVEQYEEGQRLGITGTPTMFLNGMRIDGAMPFEELNKEIVQMLPLRNRIAR